MQRSPAEPNAAATRWSLAKSIPAFGQHDGVVLGPAQRLHPLATRRAVS
jgi:hypothetical protein